jgi:WD40 repeat protein
MLVFRTDFLITTSIDGHLKFWKKQDTGIEFVKHYRAHLASVIGVSASADGQLFASVAEDGTAKVFDIINFGNALAIFMQMTTPLIEARRHDQYGETWVHTACMLLGPQTRTSPRAIGNVSHRLGILIVVC